MQHDHVLKIEFWRFDPTPGSWSRGRGTGVCVQNICHHVAAFVILFNLIWKFNFDLSGSGGGGMRAKYLLPCCCIPDSFNLIHIMTRFWEIWILILLAPSQGGEGWRGGGICGQNICYHVAAFEFLFNLICNRTMFWKKLSFDLKFLTPTPKSTQGVGHQPSIKNHVLYVFIHVCMRNLNIWPLIPGVRVEI